MIEIQKKIFPDSVACIHQWSYPVINLGRNEYRNCCKTSATKLEPSELDKYGTNLILNSSAERERRARALLGQKIDSCSSCWVTESKKVWSPRVSVQLHKSTPHFEYDELQSNLEKLSNADERVRYLVNHPVTLSKKVKVLDIILTNTCDMQCMYCSHHYSSKWAAERVKYNEIHADNFSVELPTANKNYTKVFLEWFKAEGVHIVDSINFIGGEPSLIKDFYEISETIAQVLNEKRKNIVILSVVTNLNSSESVFNKFTAHLIKISDPFSEIHLDISMEAFGKRAEYIRHGLNWKTWQKNICKIARMKIPKAKIGMQMATNILSISSLPDLLNYILLIYKKYDVAIYLKQNIVTDPPAHAAMLLTPKFTRYIDKALKIIAKNFKSIDPVLIGTNELEFNTWERYGVFLKTIRNSIEKHTLGDEEKNLVRNFFNQFNERRKLDIYKTFPEYKRFFSDCGIANNRKFQWSFSGLWALLNN